MKTIPAKMLFFFFLINISFYYGTIMAGDKPPQKKDIQEIEQKNIKDAPNREVSTKRDIVDYIPLIVFILTSLIIFLQINRQHKNNIVLQKENNREKLKLEIYKEYRKKISVAANKLIVTNINAGMLMANFNTFERQRSTQHSTGIKPLQLSERAPVFSKMHFSVLRAISDLMSFIEEYEIINPNLEIFRTAFSYASHCITETYNPLHLILLEFLPHDVPLKDQSKAGVDVIIPNAPSKEDLARIKKIVTPYIESLSEAGCYVSDLSKEAQNICIGSLFSNHLPPREPIDKRHIVISTEPQKAAELKKYFFEETEWGKNATKLNEKILMEVNKDDKNDAQ